MNKQLEKRFSTRKAVSMALYNWLFHVYSEIVAKSIIPKVSEDYNLPVLTLMLDEQTGKAGVSTASAFVDLLTMDVKSKSETA